jgi:hypothetical protein
MTAAAHEVEGASDQSVMHLIALRERFAPRSLASDQGETILSASRLSDRSA